MFTLDLHSVLLHCHRIIRLLYLLAPRKKKPYSNFCSPIFYRLTRHATHDAMVLREKKSFPKCTTKNTHRKLTKMSTRYGRHIAWRFAWARTATAPLLEIVRFQFQLFIIKFNADTFCRLTVPCWHWRRRWWLLSATHTSIHAPSKPHGMKQWYTSGKFRHIMTYMRLRFLFVPMIKLSCELRLLWA